MKANFDKIMRNFILNEGTANPNSYIQALNDALCSLKPTTTTDFRRIEIAKENLNHLKRHIRRLDEKVSFLEEELKVLQENNKE